MVQTLQPLALGLIVTWPTLSTITIGLRLWSRWLMRKFYWDDAVILLAWLLAIGECACVYKFSILSYQGYHYYDIPKMSIAQQVQAKKFDISNQWLYIPILGLVKASVIIFLWRLEDPRRRIRFALACFFVFNIGVSVSTFFGSVFQCTPVHYYWDAPRMDTLIDGKVVKRGGTCINQLAFYLIQSGLAVFTDILILLIPLAMMWNLRMERRKKIAVWVILSLGWIVAVIGIVRIVLYYYRFQPDNIDRSYSVAYTVSGMEVNVAIITACGPALKALFTRYLPRMLSSRNNSEPRGHVQYWPRGFEASNNRSRTQRMGSWTSKPSSRPRDIHYGMEILESIEREHDAESQEAIVRHESVMTDKSGFDFGFTGEKAVLSELTACSSNGRPG